MLTRGGASPKNSGGLAEKVLAVLSVSFLVGYPFAVFLGLTYMSARQVASVVLVVVLARVFLGMNANTRRQLQALALQFVPVAVLMGLAVVLDDRRFILALPVLVSAAMLVIFARSLFAPMTLLERFARLQHADMRPEEQVHCRRFTIVWCLFIAFNGAVAGLLAVAAPISLWALYTGLISYLLVGVLLTTEFVIRRIRFRRFGSGVIDRIALRFLGRSASIPVKRTDQE